MSIDRPDDARGRLRPIETRYRGYRFRSRLEARWGVYFDALGIQWHYEPEGFDLGSAGGYLPDFWLPQVRMYAEVKPAWPNDAELGKIIALARQSDRAVLVLDGVPDSINYWGAYPTEDIDDFQWIDHFIDDINKYWLTEGRFFTSTGEKPFNHCRNDGLSITDGVYAARAARFEHGENGMLA